MTNKKKSPNGKTPAQQKEKLTEKDRANVARELSDEELKDVSGGWLRTLAKRLNSRKMAAIYLVRRADRS